MAMIYDGVFKVPVWITLDDMSKQKTRIVGKWLEGAGAMFMEWPGKTFPEFLMSYRNKGYEHALPNYPFVLDPNLLTRAVSDHIKQSIASTSYLGGSISIPVSRLDRKVTSNDDVTKLFNTVMDLEDPIAVSQMFRIRELCHNEHGRQYKAWYSNGPAPKKLLNKVASSVISVGDGDECDLSLKDVTKDELESKLTDFFNNISV